MNQDNGHEGEILTCKLCGGRFVHPWGEQQWMREKFGDEYRPPRVCPECRKQRKTRRAVERVHHRQEDARKARPKDAE